MNSNLIKLIVTSIVSIVILLSNIFVVLFIMIWVILSNYEMCTIPFERECWKPDKVYQEDPITDKEIRDLVHGEGKMLDTRQNMSEESIIKHYDVSGKLTIEDEAILENQAQMFVKNVPILDMASVRRVNQEEKELEKKKAEVKDAETADKSVIFDATADDDINSNTVYKITDVKPIDGEMRSKLEKLLYRTDVNKEGRGNKFAALKSQNILDVFIQAGEKNGIDPVFLISIAMHETGNGTSYSLHNRNNVGGIRCPNLTQPQKQEFGYLRCEETSTNGKFSVWSSIEGSIKYKAYLLNKFYANDTPPKLTIKDVGMKYAPVSDNKDPQAMNSHWTPMVGQRLMSLGVNNVGDLLVDGIKSINSIVGNNKRPDFQKYNFSKVYFEGKIDEDSWSLPGDKYWGVQKKRVELSKVVEDTDTPFAHTKALNDVTEKQAQKYLDENLKGFFTNYTVEDAMISEAELQLRTLLQFDLDGTIGMNGNEYEVAHALLRLFRQVENLEKGYTEDDFENENMKFKMKNELPISTKLLKNYREEYKEFLGNLNEYDPSITLDENIKNSVDVNNIKRNFILTRAAKSGMLYPYIVLVLKKLPIEYNDELGKEIKKAFKDYEKDKNIEPMLLSTLSVGRLMQRNASEYFVDNYAWFSPLKKTLKKDFEEYVDGERERAKLGVDTFNEREAKGFWATLNGDILNSPLSVWSSWKVAKNISREYMDFSVKKNTFIKFGIYTNTREMMEMGAFTKDICYFQESYNSQTCMIANNSTYGKGAYEWEESDVLDKTIQEVNFATACEYIPDSDGDGVHDHLDDYPNDSSKTNNEEEMAKEKERERIKEMKKSEENKVKESAPKEKVKPLPPHGPQMVLHIENSDSVNTAVASFFKPEWLKKGVNKAKNLGDEIWSSGKATFNEVTGFMSGKTITLAPKNPFKGTFTMNINGDLPKQLNVLFKEEDEETMKKLYKNLLSAYEKITNGKYDVEIGIKDDNGILVGSVLFKEDGKVMKVSYIDILHNRKKEFSYEDLSNCNSLFEKEVTSYSKTLNAYYRSTYEIMAKTKDFNMYHTKLRKTENTEEKFKKEVAMRYREMTNVDAVENEEFIENFNAYLTNRSVGVDGTSSDFTPGGYLESNPGLISGLETQMPVMSKQVRITSLVGSRSCSGCSSNHKGNDLTAVPRGTSVPIVAFADGILYKKSSNDSYNQGLGNYVVLKHKTDNGTIFTRYAHLRSGSIEAALSNYTIGDKIARGTKIAMMGGGKGEPGAGSSTGIHLHIDVIQSSVYDVSKKVNPTPFLPITPENTVCSFAVNKPDACKEMGLKFSN